MRKIYYFVFYSMYKVIRKTPNKDIAQWVAIIAISLLLVFNFFVLMNYVGLQFYKIHAKEILMILFFLVLTLNYNLFLAKDKFKLIIKECTSYNYSLQVWGMISVLLYVLFSIVFLVYVINTLVESG